MNIKLLATKYRARGWNVIPLFGYSKNPGFTPDPRSSHLPEYTDVEGNVRYGWDPLKTRKVTDEEFQRWFSDPRVTGVGVITGSISGLVVADEDSYKADGMKFGIASPMVAKTARGGGHHCFRYTEPVKTSGFRKGVNIEIKSDGGFIVLTPSQVYLDQEKMSGPIGMYTWLSYIEQDKLPTITEADLKPYKAPTAPDGRVVLSEHVGVAAGARHERLRTVALSTFNSTKIVSDFEVNLSDQLRSKNLTTKAAKNEIVGYLTDLHGAKLTGHINTPELFKLKQNVNKDYQSVAKKIDTGTTLNDREKVIVVARQTLDDIITAEHPAVKDATRMQSHLYDAAESLHKSRGSNARGFGVSVLGKYLGLPANTSQRIADKAGRQKMPKVPGLPGVKSELLRRILLPAAYAGRANPSEQY